MHINFYLKDRNSTGKTALYVQVNYNGNKLKFYPGESILPEFWNEKTMRAEQKTVLKQKAQASITLEKKPKDIRRKFDQCMEFNERLNRIESTMTSIFIDYRNRNSHQIPSPAILKLLFDTAMKSNGSRLTFLEFFSDFYTRTSRGQRMNPANKKPVDPSSAKAYLTTLNHLKDFNTSAKRKVDFDTIDLDFHKHLTEYLASSPRLLSANTIGGHIKRIKAVMAEATENGLNSNLAFKSRHFIKQVEDSENIYLNEFELQKLKCLNLNHNPKLDRCRDLFLIGCYTGLRFSDFSRLEPKNIDGDMLTIVQKKTDKAVVIPIHQTVKMILAKYNGIPPKQISGQKLNDYLKEVGALMPELSENISKTMTKGGRQITIIRPKWAFLSTHCARRSFCTNEYLNGVDPILLMAISGHRSHVTFLKYIKVSPQEHAKRLQEIWAKRNLLKVA